MKCFKCGADLTGETRFCGHCGTLVQDPHGETLVVEGLTPEGELERLRMVLHGEFEVERELARGGMGVVYVARDAALGRQVALKVLAFDRALTVRSAERFKREARMVADLEHPNIVPVYRVGERGGVLFIAMKLVQGRSLDAIIAEQGALPLSVALHVLRGSTRALTWAHERGIVHRDVKSANFLIDHDGRVLISDFGVALRASDITLTMDGALIGTPAYMSPEQCTGKRAGPQSDQYSLGVVAFELLTGVAPFTSDTLAGYIKHHLYSPLPNIRLARTDMPETLIAVLERALQKDAELRFPTTRDMLDVVESLPFTEADRRSSEDALSRLVRGADVPKIPTRSLPPIADVATVMMPRQPTPPPPPPPRRSRAVLWASVAGAAAVAGGLAVALGALRDGAPNQALATPPQTPAETAAAPALAAPRIVSQPQPAPGALRVLVNPTSAEIVVDGTIVGVGSVVDIALAAGQRRIRLRATGYQPFDTVVTVKSGSLVNLRRVTLQPRSGS